jgi:succinate dehydrogenase / fumarate reductase cytochrome b subunit
MSANRPLSPHLQVYRLPLTGIVSITHRMTGVMLSMGLILFVYVMIAIASGEGMFLAMQSFMSYWLFKLVYWGFIYAMFFHLCHGTRHLIWDIGKTFDRDTLDKFALYELIASASLTLLTFVMA